MTESVLLDPTDEREPLPRRLASRPDQLAGTIGLLDIAKPRGDVFLDHLAGLLQDRHPDVRVLRFTKPTFTKPAPVDLRREIATKCDFVIEALAD